VPTAADGVPVNGELQRRERPVGDRDVAVISSSNEVCSREQI